MTDQVAKVTDAPPPVTLETKAPIGWPLFILQLATVVVVYFVASVLPLIPFLIEQVSAGTPDAQPGSFLTALTVMFSMACALLLCWVWLRREGRVAEAWDLSAPESWSKTLGWAAMATIGAILIFTVGAAAVQAMGLPAPDASLILDLVTESPLMFAVWVIGVAILAAGTGEELLWRGFLMDRLERLGGLRGRVWLVLIVQALLFALPHSYQGIGGMVLVGGIGLLLGWVRIMQRGNLWAVIIAHASVDVIMMSLAYAGSLGWFAAS